MSTCLLLASSGNQPTYVIDLLAILATAAVVAILMQRVRLAVIPAYLIAGTLLGPSSLRVVQSTESLTSINNLAIVLLMFGIGLHLHLSALGRSLTRLLVTGAGSCVLSIVVGWPLAILFGLNPPQALTMCMALSLSSTAVVLRLIADRGELRHTTGRIALAILVVQDMMVIPMLAAMPVIAAWTHSGKHIAALAGEALSGNAGDFALTGLTRLGGIAALIAVGRLLLPRLLQETARDRSGEVMMITSIAAAIGAGAVTHALGFNMELGAFLAGFLLAATPFRHQISGQIAPLRDLFLAVFFTSLGMQLNPATLAQWWWVILLGGTVMSLIKAATIGFTCWSLGATASMAVAVGMSLAQGGEFGLILLQNAGAQGILSDTVRANAIAIIVISLILTPGMVELGRRFARRWEHFSCAPWVRNSLRNPPPNGVARGQVAPSRHVIIAGYGQVGQAIARSLDDARLRYAVIELNPGTVRSLTRRENPPQVVYGDVSHADVLDSAGLDHADALILTMPDESAVLSACATARRKKPGIFIAARMQLERHDRTARDLGADVVIVEELEAARAMREAVIAHLKSPAYTA